MRSGGRNPLGILPGVDALFAMAMALAAVTYGNSGRMPNGGIHQFLEMRITILNAAFAGLFMLAWSYCFRALDLYGQESQGVLRKLGRIAKGCGAMTGLLVSFLYATHTTGPSAQIGGIFFVYVFVYEACRVIGGTWIAARDPQLVLILGSGRRAVKAWREIRTRYHSTVKLVGFVDDRPVSEMAPDVADRYLGTINDLNDLLLHNVVDELLIAMPIKSCYGLIQRAIPIAEQVGVRVVCMQDTYATTVKMSASHNRELFSELVPFHEHYVTRQAVKRLVDIIGALVGLCLFSPLFLLVAIAIKATSKGPVFFKQQRYGYRRRLFGMYKFRSMVEDASELMAQLEKHKEPTGPIFKMRHDPRITPLGRILRGSSLDELPQLCARCLSL